MMKRFLIIAAAAPFALGWSAAALADGALKTMPHGRYQCSVPGDAAGPARNLVEEAHFRIASASSYRSAKGRGTYLMRGKELIFTRGPKLGEMYQRIGDNALQKLDKNGELTPLLCHRIGPKLPR